MFVFFDFHYLVGRDDESSLTPDNCPVGSEKLNSHCEVGEKRVM